MPFEFIAGHVALDFVATVAERTTTRVERLREPADLAQWLADAGVLDAPPPVTELDLENARELREALYAYVVHLTGGPLPAEEVRRILNRHAETGTVALRLDRRWQPRRTGDVRSALGDITRSALDLGHDDDRREAIRWCAGAACTRPFLDRSHGRRRRWCGMSTCGDKAKASAYRARRAGRTAAKSAGAGKSD
jgi:predicted RNA-binding Zn ribbon-like protein